MRMRLMWMVLMLAAAPAAYAHTPEGTPKNYCEDDSEAETHDYVALSAGVLLGAGDGNIAGDCDGDGLLADFDGHAEYAFGGAWITVESGDGVTSGSIACGGEGGHHAAFGPFTVFDAVHGSTISFTVGSDTVNLVPPTDPAEPNCGDFQSDNGTTCVYTCTVTFPAGLDGTYQVYVGDAITGSFGTMGHVVVPGGCGINVGSCPGSCGLNIGVCAGRCTANVGYCSKHCRKPVNVGEC